MIPTTSLILNMMHELKKTEQINIKAKSGISITKKHLFWADVVLFIRGADPYMEMIAKAAHESGRYCILYLDDDLLNIPGYKDNLYDNALKDCLYYCDLLWSSNSNIIKKYLQYMHHPHSVEEKVFDPINCFLPCCNDINKIRIIFAGSSGHIPNLQKYIIPALNKIGKKFDFVDVTFIGIKKQELSDIDFHAKFVPWFNNLNKYKNFVSQSGFHIGLAVIEDSDFYHCKYYNKFLEYTKMGVLGIYTDCDPYRFIVKDHENGLLTQNTPSDWERNLEEAIMNAELRTNCIHKAQKLVQEQFNMSIVLKCLLSKIPELTSYKSNKSYPITYKSEHLLFRFLYMFSSWKTGYKLIETAIKIKSLITLKSR